ERGSIELMEAAGEHRADQSLIYPRVDTLPVHPEEAGACFDVEILRCGVVHPLIFQTCYLCLHPITRTKRQFVPGGPKIFERTRPDRARPRLPGAREQQRPEVRPRRLVAVVSGVAVQRLVVAGETPPRVPEPLLDAPANLSRIETELFPYQPVERARVSARLAVKHRVVVEQ